MNIFFVFYSESLLYICGLKFFEIKNHHYENQQKNIIYGLRSSHYGNIQRPSH
jgi:hypothetical protein